MPRYATADTLPAELWTVNQAAEYLQVTDRTVRNFISRGQLSARRVGTRAIRVPRLEVEKFAGVNVTID